MSSPLCQEQCLTGWAVYWSGKILSTGTPGVPWSMKSVYTERLHEAQAARAKLEAENRARASQGLPQTPPSLLDLSGGPDTADLPGGPDDLLGPIRDAAAALANALLNSLESAVCGAGKNPEDGGVGLCPK